jgi:histidyl-tRNA synthetase
MVRRNYIFDTIRNVYKKYGYQPIETPAMENTETLMGKYGEEGDRLIFRVLNSANYLSDFKSDEDIIASKNAGFGAFTNKISEKALRYDLTVPFARYVVQHQNEISFPFKRYQIQPVWRADRPQKGRYREFYQCDADVIGSNSLINEVELVQIIDEVFTALDVKVLIHFSNRKVLQGIAEAIGYPDKMLDIAIAIDKLDKIGLEAVNKELSARGLSEKAVNSIQPIINPETRTRENITRFLTETEIGRKGLEEVTFLGVKAKLLGIDESKLYFDISLARGLNYYTGTIFEVKVNDPKSTFTSSIAGGGRYDDLTGIFGLPGLSGVGISFGADRIYDVLAELNLYPENVTAGTRVLFANFGGEDEAYSLQLLKKVRAQNIAAEIYPDNIKMGKQFKYADAKQIPFVAIIGENERTSGMIMLKNLQTGEQSPVTFEELIHKIL